MSGVGVRVTREGVGLSLPDTIGGTVGVVTGDNEDWEDGGGAPGSIPGPPVDTSDFELNIEGGQDVIFAHGSMGATEAFDPSDGNVHTGTLNANLTPTLSAPSGTGAVTLELWITEDVTGGWTVAMPAATTEVGTHDTTAGTTQRVIVESVDAGTSWLWTWIGAGATGTAGGDLSGTYPNPTVAKVNGVTVTGTPSAGQVLTATSASAADWETPSASSSAASEHAHVMDCLFSGDASTTAWTLPVAPVDQYSVAAYVSGVLTEVTLSGTVFDIATFGSAPAAATNNIRFDIVAATT